MLSKTGDKSANCLHLFLAFRASEEPHVLTSSYIQTNMFTEKSLMMALRVLNISILLKFLYMCLYVVIKF